MQLRRFSEGSEPIGFFDEGLTHAREPVDWGRIAAVMSEALADGGWQDAEFRFDTQGRTPRGRTVNERHEGRHFLDAPDPWIIILLLAKPIALFAEGFVGEAGKDAYLRFKTTLRRVKRAPEAGAVAVGKQVQLQDRTGGPRVKVHETLGAEALAALKNVDWNSCDSDAVLVWSPRRRRWVKSK